MAFFRSRSPSRVDTQGMTKDQAKELARLMAIVDDNAQDLKARRALADLYKAAGRTKHAVAEYQALAGAYAAQGLLFRAIATCKQILTLDPEHDETHKTLAALYAKQDAQAEVALNVELPASMADALVVEDASVVDSDQAPPPMPAASDEGVALEVALLDADRDIVSIEDVVDAGTLAALTVKPEGSVVLKRPASVPLFSGLAPKAFELLVKELTAWEAEPGAVVVAEGETGDSLFVVARGKVRVERNGKEGAVVVGHVGEAGFFGEIAIIAQRPRAATVIAEETTELLEISRKTLDELCVLDPRVREVLDAFCSERLKKSVLLSSPVFEGLSPELLARVSAGFEQRAVPAGESLVEQGAPSTGLFVVLSGTVDVTAKAEFGAMRLKELHAGDVFGEMSLLSGEPASASVTSSAPVRLLVLPASSFSSLSSEPELQARIAALSSSRAAFNARFLPATDAREGSV